MGGSIFWILVVFVGGAIVLGAAIAWAQRHNKQTRAEFERTEAATRELYDGDPVDRRPN